MASYINTTSTIGTTAVVVLPNRTRSNEKRTAFILTNNSTGTEKISIAIGEEAVDGEGIILFPGGSWHMSLNDFPPQDKITAISDQATGKLSIYEEAK